MILEFTFNNFACFRDECTFSLLGTKERQHSKRLVRLHGFHDAKVLPVASVFGANAAGKSTFIAALLFAKQFVTSPADLDDLIPVSVFQGKGGPDQKNASAFSFVVLVGEDLFRYSFEVDQKQVFSERLAKIRATRDELLFERDERRAEPSIRFGNGLADTARLEAVFLGTRRNQLFLNNAAFQNVETFRSVFEWFRDQLEIIDPGAWFVPVERFFDRQSPLCGRLQKALDDLDTGIADLELVEVPAESVALPPDASDRIASRLKEGMMFRFRFGKDIVVFSREDGAVKARRMVAVHRDAAGGTFRLPMTSESDGTIRLIDLLPAFFTLGDPASRKVYVVDELDRSLHPTLMRYLVETFLKTAAPDTRSQIVFTTHDIDLMTQDLFRRDEMWIVRKNPDGGSDLLCLGDFKDIRYDKDIRKSYMEGRFGGIPRISPALDLAPSGTSVAR